MLQITTVAHITVPALNVRFPAKITKQKFCHTSYYQVKYQTPTPFQEIFIYSKQN